MRSGASSASPSRWIRSAAISTIWRAGPKNAPASARRRPQPKPQPLLHNHDSAVGERRHLVGNGAQQNALQLGKTSAAHDDGIGLGLAGVIDDRARGLALAEHRLDLLDALL